MNFLFKRKEYIYSEPAYDSNSGTARKGEFLNDAREFYDPETASSYGLSHVPSHPMSRFLPAS